MSPRREIIGCGILHPGMAVVPTALKSKEGEESVNAHNIRELRRTQKRRAKGRRGKGSKELPGEFLENQSNEVSGVAQLGRGDGSK